MKHELAEFSQTAGWMRMVWRGSSSTAVSYWTPSVAAATEASALGSGAALQFRELSRIWRQATAHMSSLTDMTSHTAYRHIVALGAAVVPFLLDELRTEPRFWFPALREITGENPVSPADRGNVQAMADAWIAWGRARRLIN